MVRTVKPLAIAIVFSFAQGPLAAQDNPSMAGSSAGSSMQERLQNLASNVKKSLRFLKGGSFDMGDWGKEERGRYFDFDTFSRPLHKVSLDGFSMMAYKVTYEEFDVFTDATGKKRVGASSRLARHRAPKRPAGVSWFGAKDYCKWLGTTLNLPVDLPTEAQWEYAARSGGKRVVFATDNGKVERGRNFPDHWKEGPEPPLLDVGSYPPNPAGLYGMSEDTGEWVNDWFDPDYYKVSPEKNPTGPSSGTEKVMRGSVGGTAEIAAGVFMRKTAAPQPVMTAYPQGLGQPAVELPLPGYSGFRDNNFRCVVNSTTPINH